MQISSLGSAAPFGGITLCGREFCKICALYLQECDSFETSNGTLWEIRCHIHCNSLNVLYFVVCNFCSKFTKVGKTDNLRDRTNNHITCCRWGSGTDIFDLHVHACAKKTKKTTSGALLQTLCIYGIKKLRLLT